MRRLIKALRSGHVLRGARRAVPGRDRDPGSERRSIRLNSALSMLGLLLLGGTRVLYGSLISRSTDPETYGMVAVLIAATLIFSFILPGGLGSAISRFVPYARGSGDLPRARGLYRRLTALSLGAALLFGLLAAVAAAHLGRPASQVAELGLLTTLYSLYVTQKAGLYAFDEVTRYVALEALASAITIATLIALIVSGSTLYLTPLILGYGAFVAGSAIALRRHAPGSRTSPAPAEQRGILAYAFLASLGSLAGAGFLQATQLLAAEQASLTAAAFFGASVTLIAPLYFLPRALSLALFPFMSEAHGAGQVAVVRHHADVATRALLVLLAPVFIAAQLLAGEILTLYGGAAFAAGALIMQIMLLAAYFAVVQVPSINALSSASGRGLRTSVGWAVAGAATGLVLVVLLAQPLGATGVAVAYFAGAAVTAAGPMAVVWRKYSMEWLGPLARSVAMVFLAFVGARLLAVGPLGDQRSLVNGTAALVGLGLALLVLRDHIGDVLRAGRPERDFAVTGRRLTAADATRAAEIPSRTGEPP